MLTRALPDQNLPDALQSGKILLEMQPERGVDYSNDLLKTIGIRRQIIRECLAFGCRLLCVSLVDPTFTVSQDSTGIDRIALICRGMRHPDCRFNIQGELFKTLPPAEKEDVD